MQIFAIVDLWLIVHEYYCNWRAHHIRMATADDQLFRIRGPELFSRYMAKMVLCQPPT